MIAQTAVEPLETSPWAYTWSVVPTIIALQHNTKLKSHETMIAQTAVDPLATSPWAYTKPSVLTIIALQLDAKLKLPKKC